MPVLLAVLVLAIGAGLALEGLRRAAEQPAATDGTGASPAPTAGAAGANVIRVDDFGYTIELPHGWRRSERLSLRTGRAPQLGHDLYTARTLEDEAAGVGGHTAGPAWIWSVTVRVEKDPDGLSPRQWFEEGHLGHGVGERAIDTTFDGRAALRVENGPSGALAFVVPRGEDKFVISYSAQDDVPAPASVTREVLERIVASVRLLDEDAIAPSSSPRPNASTVAGIETFRLGAATDEWVFLTRLRNDARSSTVRAELWAVELHGTRRQIVATYEEPRSLTTTVLRRQLSPSGQQIVLSTPEVRGSQVTYRLTIVDITTGATQVLTDGSAGRDLSPAWSPDGSRIAFVRTDLSGNGSALWTIAPSGALDPGPHVSGQILLHGWTADGSGIGYATDLTTFNVLDPRSADGNVVFERKMPVDPAGPVDWRRSSSMFTPQLVGVFSTDIEDGTRPGGDITIEVAERDGRGQRAIVHAPKPLSAAESFFQPRWDPEIPVVMYRKGYELWKVGALESSQPTRIAVDGRVLRAEWRAATGFGHTGIVYVLDGPEGLERGATVHVAFGDGSSPRTIFTPPDEGSGLSDVEDIAVIRMNADSVADPRGTARERVDVEGRPYRISEAFLWRDFMPISPPDGKPLIGSIRVRVDDTGSFPVGVTADRVWIYGPDLWETTPTEIRRAPEGGTRRDEIEIVVREGPKWEPGTKVDVVVRLRSGGGSYYLKLTGVTIERTS